MDFKTFNNEILINALKSGFGIEAEASGRSDLVIQHEGVNKKISGSAYKMNPGDPQTGVGKRSLHHGTMLLDLELNALGKYLNPSKAKLESKGVESVMARLINMHDVDPSINHDTFCDAAENSFIKRWDTGAGINKCTIPVADLEQTPKFMEIYKKYENKSWRFGEKPTFKKSLEKKFDWALVDI